MIVRRSTARVRLLAAGEERLAAAGVAEAWLAVVAGNARARRFYERQGWSDGGPLDYAAETADRPVTVPCRRYVKRLHRQPVAGERPPRGPSLGA